MEVAARTHTHTHTHNGRHCVSARIGPAMIQFKLARKRWTVKRKKKKRLASAMMKSSTSNVSRTMAARKGRRDQSASFFLAAFLLGFCFGLFCASGGGVHLVRRQR